MVSEPRARLFCKTGDLRGVEIVIEERASIGRGDANTLVLPQGLVSTEHARIELDPDTGSYQLEDLGSLNGTQLDGLPVDGKELLGALHVITFADKHDFIFQRLEGAAVEAPLAEAPVAETPAAVAESTRPESILPSPLAAIESQQAEARPEKTVEDGPSSLALRAEEWLESQAAESEEGGGTQVENPAVALPGALLSRAEEMLEDAPEEPLSRAVTRADEGGVPLPAGLAATGEEAVGDDPAIEASASSFFLEIEEPDEQPRRLPLLPGENSVGRSKHATVRLRSPDISRRQAVIEVRGKRVTVRDAGGPNPTHVAGVPAEGEVEVKPGVTLTFGSITARLIHEPE